MIPLYLKLTGFLSYRDPVEVDFTGFDLACISGQNGAGKSSLLDAITWALFGQARKRDDSLINLQSTAAEVSFTFAYENNQYRVIRSLAREKSTMLEFQISSKDGWRPLTEHTNRETQLRIERVLRLDYETFINVSFFLQGHADQFAQQPPTRRKEILGNILGLEIWEVYKERTAEHRKALEGELGLVDGHIAEIDAELAEEEPRKMRLSELEIQLGGLAASRRIQEAALASVKNLRAGLEERRHMVQKLAETLERSQATLGGLENRLAGREAERLPAMELVKRASEVEKAYNTIKKNLEKLGRQQEMSGITVQQMINGGIETIVGVTQDQSFGPLMMFGSGGIYAELIKDVTMKLHPITDLDAIEMINSLKMTKLFEGYRGSPPSDVKALQNLLLRVSAMVEDIPEIAELDLNPVNILPRGEGYRVIDARIMLK